MIDLTQITIKNINKRDRWHPSSILTGAIIATAVLLLIFSQEVCADSLDVNLTSIHYDTTYKYNTKNFGIGYTKDLDKHWQVQGGTFKNSYNKDSLYAMINLKHEMNGWNWGIAFGFVSGYDNIEAKEPKQITTSYGKVITKKDEIHDIEHDKSNTKYKYKYAKHSHPKNLNKLQFMVLPNVTWKINKKHRLQFNYIPSFSKAAFVGVRYQFILGD
jgi:hypothetical protein